MISEKDFMEALDNVRNEWGDKVIAVACLAEKKPMDFSEFLNECTCCGGNWGGMLLTGIRKLWPEVWDIIPNKMGNRAFITICSLLIILGVDTSEEE